MLVFVQAWLYGIDVGIGVGVGVDIGAGVGVGIGVGIGVDVGIGAGKDVGVGVGICAGKDVGKGIDASICFNNICLFRSPYLEQPTEHLSQTWRLCMMVVVLITIK